MTSSRITGSLALLLSTVLPTIAYAQRQHEPEPLSVTPLNCLQSGSDHQFVKVCYSDHGNIISLEWPAEWLSPVDAHLAPNQTRTAAFVYRRY